MRQYRLVLINLDPTVGSEMKKTGACVGISPDEMNEHLQTIVIAPITGSAKAYPTRVEINHPKTKGWIALYQVRTVDKQRITKAFESLTDEEILGVKTVIQETYVA